MFQSLEVFFSSNAAFFGRVLHERPSNIYCMCIIAIMVIALVGSFAIVKSRGGNLSIGVITAILALGAAVIVPALILMWSNSDAVMLSTYEEAESLYNENWCQAAKELYWTIYAKDYRDCREKIALCDYRSANYYITKNEYDKAFELLFPYLSTNPTGSSPETIDNMRRLVETTADGVSNTNQVNLSFVNPAWALGKWSDTSDHYIHFYMGDSEIKCGQNLCSQDWKGSHYRLTNGILSYNVRDNNYWIDEFIFCPTSGNESYVYSITDGKMYFLTRNDELV